MTAQALRHSRPRQNRSSLAVCFVGTDLYGGSAIDLMRLPNSIKIGYARFFDHVPTLKIYAKFRTASLIGSKKESSKSKSTQPILWPTRARPIRIWKAEKPKGNFF